MSKRFKVISDTLAKEIRLTHGWVTETVHLPATKYVKMSVVDGRARITATDTELAITRSFEADTTGLDEPFIAVIPAEKLAEIAKECPGQLEIEHGECGRAKKPAAVIHYAWQTQQTENLPSGPVTCQFKLITGDAAQFPSSGFLPKEFAMLEVPAPALVAGLRWTLPAVKGSERYGLILRLDQSDKTLTMGGTNGRVLATYGNVEARRIRAASKPLILPERIAKVLLDVLEREMKLDASASGSRTLGTAIEVRFEEARNAVCFIGNHWHLSAKLDEAVRFPEQAWEIVKQEKTHYAAVEADSFRKAFKQLSKLVSGDHDPIITIRFDEKGIVLLAQSDKDGSAEQRLDGAWHGGKLEVSAPPYALKDWLTKVAKDDWIGICAISKYEPILFLCQSVPHATWIIGGARKEPKAAPTPQASTTAAAA